ncbi:hypothetical protein RE432_15260 [Pusillimonas sp. SM2304]|uniref:hypothetical protein n=1 Tax=Pusillimonas sp. SM2304 TaxID=3073241 RepID=UPI002875A755|nr:hypothetical protein [Pusillimonas sp. SM2304]MDS1141799.1 hypothetical protein [Pusillimonas sp. SM2304]
MKPLRLANDRIPCYRAAGTLLLGQGGQAVLEGLLVLVVLASLWVAGAWLGHLQDMALSAQHASRQAAFSLTRNPADDPAERIRQQYFSGPSHQWSDRRGARMLGESPDSIQLRLDRHAMLQQSAQPGGDDASAESLRRSWRVQDGGIVTARLRVAPQPQGSRPAGAAFASGLNDFDIYPVLHRHTAILAGAGHAAEDAQVQHILAQSPLAWHDSANTAYALGRKIDNVMGLVDAPWRRDRPVLDWLGPWAGDIPASRLDAVQKGAQ